MKKILVILLVALMAVNTCSCSNSKTPESSSGKLEGSLEEIMEKIYEGFDPNFPKTEITKLDDENMEYFLGTKDVEYDEAIASEPMMSAHAHSIVLLRAPKDSDIEEVKQKIKDNVDGRKWICVGVEDEDIIVDNVDNLVILIMDENSKKIHESFSNLVK